MQLILIFFAIILIFSCSTKRVYYPINIDSNKANYKITTIKKIQGLDAFLVDSKNQNRIFVAKNVTKKAYKQFNILAFR